MRYLPVGAGGNGTGIYNFNTALNKLELFPVNTLPLGGFVIPVTFGGGGITYVALPAVGGAFAGAATVQAGVPFVSGVDLGQQIRAANDSTKIATDPNKDKNKLNDDGC